MVKIGAAFSCGALGFDHARYENSQGICQLSPSAFREPPLPFSFDREVRTFENQRLVICCIRTCIGAQLR
jgi:hypothetical protein